MNEITKPNDMLVSTLVNGNVSTLDLLSNGINAGNTQLLDPQSYKESKLIKQRFTDGNGNFNTEEFNKAYISAAKQYSDLAEMNSYDKLSKYVEYNQKDIFAPLDAKRTTPAYEIEKELNPLRLSHGVDSLFDYGRQTKSMRELAQQSKIWDSEKGIWLDKTADERGVLGSLFGKSLVYATYDEDTDEEDPLTGRIIHHKKGEWKLNDKGQYYTETIGNRSGYGKQFVVASDTLTSEDSALNKIDFFDSDDIEKSATGTIVKTAVKILPYIFPHTRMVFGGVTAALEMAKVMPTFAKMVEGLFIGGDADNETAFTRTMNTWENYFSKFNESYSDEGQKSNWGSEKMLDMVADTVSQLYQMRAAASLSKFAVKDPSRQAIKKFQDEYLPRFIQANLTANSGLQLTAKEFDDVISMAVSKMPEVAEAIRKQSKVSKALSTGYMALSSSADVYSDALAGGYDRRMAGAAGLAAALGQYWIMTKEEALNLGGWFLDESVGYSEGAQRKTLLKALQPYYDEIAESIKKLDTAATKEEKVGIITKMLGKASSGLRQAKLGLKSPQYLKNGLTEAVQEVTEEAIMDATKGMFDFLSYAGLGKNKDASFGVVEDFKSGSFLERYLQNAVGGLMGGVLFEFQQNKIEPWMNKVLYGKVKDDIQPSLIHEIANGHTADLFRAIDELAELDSDIAAIPISLDGKSQLDISANGQLTRGQATANVLKDYIRTLEGVMIGENSNLSDDQILEKAIRDYQAINILKKGGLDKLLISDFTKLSSEIASIKLELEKAETKSAEQNDKRPKDQQERDTRNAEQQAQEDVEEFDDGNYSNKSPEFLRALLQKKRQELRDFLSGKKSEFYTYKTLVGATPEIKTALGDLSIYDYTYLRYGKEYKDLKRTKGTLTQRDVEKEYNDWAKETDADKKFIKLGVEAYADFEKRFSKYIIDYIKTGYNNVRKITRTKLLSKGNFTLNNLLDNDQSYKIIRQLGNLLKSQDGAKSGDITLQDIFLQDELLLKDQVEEILKRNPKVIQLMALSGKNKEVITEELTQFLATQLESINIDNLSGDSLEAIANQYFYNLIQSTLDQILSMLPEKNLGALQDYLQTNGLLSIPYDPVEEHKAVTDKETLLNFFYANLEIQSLEDISIGLGTSLLQKYITSEDTIDGVIKQRIAQEAVKSIITNISKNEETIKNQVENIVIALDADGFTVHSFNISSNDIKNLLDSINDNFDIIDLNEIISNWANDVAQKWIESENVDFYADVDPNSILELNEISKENIAKELQKKITEQINSDNIVKLYREVKSKQSKENTIYDSLSKIDLNLSESGKSKVLEILQNQHDKLRSAEKFEDYLPQGEAKIQLENALRALKLYKALVVGMREGALGLGSPFAVNQQMKRFIEKNKIQSERKYETIDEESAALILDDITILENQIKGYLQLGEKAYLTKTGQDAAIKKKYAKLLLDTINAKATAFTIRDFSILPPENERVKFTNPEQALAFYASSIFKNFTEHFKTPESKREAIHELIQNLNLDKDKINRSSRPQNLNREIESIEDFDLIMWIATSLGADNAEFYYRYNQLIIGNDKNKNTPLFSQEMAALQAWSFLKDEANVKGEKENISIHDAITEELFLINPDIEGIPSSRLFFINGITGAGKSTVVGSILSQLFSDKLIYITAANKKQIDNYSLIFKKYYPEKDALQFGSIALLLDKFFSKDTKIKILNHISEIQKAKTLIGYFDLHPTDALFDRKEIKDNIFAVLNEQKLESLLKDKIDTDVLPEIIFIDEATQVHQPILQILNFLGKKFNFKVVLSGDSVQRGAAIGTDTQAFNDLFMWKSAKLNISVRSANNQISNNNFVLNKLLEVYERFNTENPNESTAAFQSYISNPENQQVISYYQDDSTLNGYKLVSGLSEFAEDIRLIAKLNKEANDRTHTNQKVMVITKLDDSGKPVDANIETLLKQNGLLESDYELFSPDDIHDKAVQGSEARYVIIDKNCLNNDPSIKPGEVLRSVYTFLSRAQNGALMVLPQSVQDLIGIRNRKDRFTQIDEIPQLADVNKLKEARKKELDEILKSLQKPSKIELDKLKKREVNGKSEYIRSTSLPKKTTTTNKKSTSTTGTTTKSEIQLIDYEAEENLDEESKQQLIDTLNTDISEQISIESINSATGANEAAGGYVKEKNPTTSTRVYPSISHVGLKRLSNGMFERQDAGINFDLDGLFDQTRNVDPATHQGFIRFKHLLIAAKSIEDIARGIQTDRYISHFLAEACPMVAYNKQIDLGTWKTSDTLCEVYAQWFRDNVELDPNYYVFAKKLNWEVDQPTTIANPDIKKSVGEGNTVLYYGIRIKSKDGYINQYISIGTMSNRTNMESEPLQTLYARADADLMDKDFVVYQLPDTELFNLDLTSTMWIRNIKVKDGEDVDWNRFESVSEMQKRGFDIDKSHIYLVDRSKILINGKPEYKALVFLALVGTTSADINTYFDGKKLTFEQRLEKLKSKFIKDGEFLLAGSYLTFARYVGSEVIEADSDSMRSNAYNRIVFLNPKRISATELFESDSLKYVVKKDQDSKIETDQRTKLALCRPASQTKLITALLMQAKAFDDALTLEKYLVGTKQYLLSSTGSNRYLRDKETLNKIIDWVRLKRQSGEIIQPKEFIDQLNSLGHRILFHPFFFQFCYKLGNDWIIRDASKFDLDERNGVAFLNINKSDKHGDVRLVMYSLPYSYACPPLVKTNIEDQRGLLDAFGIELPTDVQTSDPFKMLQIAFNDNVSPNSLGMYGYQLQDPTFQIADEKLRTINRVEERLEQLQPETIVDPETGAQRQVSRRFPPRSAWLDVPTRPVDFDPENYAPQKLKSEDYLVDDSMKEFIVTRKTRKIIGYQTEEVKKNGKWITREKKIKGKRIPIYEEKWNGTYGKNGSNGRFVRLVATNKRGFEIRPGDYVQLWGDETKCFYVQTLNVGNPDDVQIVLTYVGDNPDGTGGKSLMRRLSEMHGKSISIDAVTKVVKRSVLKSEHKQGDIYLTGEFGVSPKYQSGKYAKVEKTPETIREMLDAISEEGEKIPSLDFDKAFFIMVPITESQVDDIDAISNPVRGGGIIIESVSDLQQKNDEFSDPNIHSDYRGYTLFRIFRQQGFTPEQQVNQRGFFDNMINSIQENAFKGNNSQFIQHQVLFDEVTVEALAKQLKSGDVTRIPYNKIEIARNLPKPEELLILTKNGELDIVQTSKVHPKGITLSKTEFNAIIVDKDKYPMKHWMYQQRVDSVTNEQIYELFPRPYFLFDYTNTENGPVYNVESDDSEVVTHNTYKQFISGNRLTPYSITEMWKGRLQGYTFKDYQAEAYEDPFEYENGRKKSKEQIDKEKSEKQNRRSILYKEGNHPNFIPVEYFITDCQFENGNIYLYYAPNVNTGESIQNGSLKKIKLEEFISQIGTRFEFISDAPRKNVNVNENAIKPIEIGSTAPSIHSAQSIQTESETQEQIPEISESESQVKIIQRDELTEDFVKDTFKTSTISAKFIAPYLQSLYDVVQVINNNTENKILFNSDLCQKMINLKTPELFTVITTANSYSSFKMDALRLIHGIILSESEKIKNLMKVEGRSMISNAILSKSSENVQQILDTILTEEDQTKLINC